MDLQPIEQIVPDLMQPFLLLALFPFCGLAISQTKVLKIVCSLVSIPQSNVKNYTSVNLLFFPRAILHNPHGTGQDFKKNFIIWKDRELTDKSKHKR